MFNLNAIIAGGLPFFALVAVLVCCWWPYLKKQGQKIKAALTGTRSTAVYGDGD